MTPPCPSTLPEILLRRAEEQPSAVAQRSRRSEGDWDATSWIDFRRQVGRLASWMIDQGLMPGDAVVIALPNSRDWDVIHLAVIAARGIAIGLDANETPEKIRKVVEDCSPVAFVAQNSELLHRILMHLDVAQKFHLVLSEADSPNALSQVHEFQSALDAATEDWPLDPARADDIATMIYTSGTTGSAKGLQYTNRQIVIAIDAILQALPDVDEQTRIACWLPLSNMFQRIMNLCAMRCGAEIWYVSDPQRVMAQVREIRPHLFVGVPRVFEKLFAGIHEELAGSALPVRVVAKVSLAIGHKYRARQRRGTAVGMFLEIGQFFAEKLLFRRVREVLGGEVRYFISGSAPMPVWLLENLHAMGWLTLEAYGLSENVVPNSMSRLDSYRFGTVGKPLSPNVIKIAKDGEVLVRSPGAVAHYANDPRQLLDKDGFLPTGDYGEIDEDGFLRLRGRKSDLFKTSTGRRISPAAVESRLLMHPLVDQVVLLGAGRPYPTALLVVQMSGGLQLENVLSQLLVESSELLMTTADYARPVGALVTTRGLSPERGELTSNLKVRRHVVESLWAEAFDDLYRWLGDGQKSSFYARAADDDGVYLCRLQSVI